MSQNGRIFRAARGDGGVPRPGERASRRAAMWAPRRQDPAAWAAVPREGVEPEAIRTGEDQGTAEHEDGREQKMPGSDDRVEGGFDSYEVEKGIVTRREKGPGLDGPRERVEREQGWR